MAVDSPVFTLDETCRVLYECIHTYVLTDINYSRQTRAHSSDRSADVMRRQSALQSSICIFDLQIITVTHKCKGETRNSGKSLPCNQWRTEGGGGLVGFKPPPEIPKALQNRAKLNPVVKTVKNC